jgi:cyclopropane fatty-acyl-phospholipid synthase-like methyltransferase|mmetsp:Transcript_28338/g.44953  ORF Transcript_28338/g.44953 Transcript_28338/m.44953 type:complete len:446 (+) Transcript_28338:75-1412(+)
MPTQAFPVFEVVIFVAERFHIVVACAAVLLFSVHKKLRCAVIVLPLLLFVSLIGLVVYDSQRLAELEGYDMSLPSMRQALDHYIDTGDGDMNDIIEGGRYPPIFGMTEVKRYLSAQLGRSMWHDTSQDSHLLPEAYNKGDDWFEATLGEPMVYTGAIYAGPNETMWSSQLNKLEFIAHALGVKEGDKGLDIGAGWGRLANHLASKGAQMTGVVMASDQQAYGTKLNERLGEKKVNIKLKNFFDLEEPPKTFNVISAVEMAEHVGIRNYNKFLRKVHELLTDDGTFYIQVAGLPRGYGDHYKGFSHYEDIVWGMFMDEHVFPGADASCPMGWVVTKLEQAGFEVQNVYNLGYHYSKTLYHWLQTWEAKKDAVVKVYGERSWRRWRVFLAWSVRTARRGGSTVQFITATKSGHVGARIAAQDRLAPGAFKLPPHTPVGPGGGPERIY